MIEIEALDTSKSNIGNILTKIIQEAKEVICPYLTDCINATIDSCCFPCKLKETDVCAIQRMIHAKTSISVLSAMSKIFERIMSEQINQFLWVYYLHCFLAFDKVIAHNMLRFG